jgi:hypothetical protein
MDQGGKRKLLKQDFDFGVEPGGKMARQERQGRENLSAVYCIEDLLYLILLRE